MDERHWWLVNKIQENFPVDPGSGCVEEFLSDPVRLDMLEQFFGEDGIPRLFIWGNLQSVSSIQKSTLHLDVTLNDLKAGQQMNASTTILYLFRPDTSQQVEILNIERDIYCGVLKGNAAENLQYLLQEVYIPLFKIQKDSRNADEQAFLMQQLRKSVNVLSLSDQSSHSKPVTLKQPEVPVYEDYKHRISAIPDPETVVTCEEIMSDWIETISNVLGDSPSEICVDVNAGPLSELQYQRRQLRLMTSIIEQLKSKESKSVLSVIVLVKSKLLKRWKIIDASLTDVMNETKDKVRFLESLEKCFEQLYDAEPATVISTALTGIVNGLKQMDSLSRFYARQGYLGFLFTKVTNQIVTVCKEYVEECTLGSIQDEDLLWKRIWDEATVKEGESPSSALNRLFHINLTNKLQKGSGKRKGTSNSDETFANRLKSCLALQICYRDVIRSLKEIMLSSSNISHLTSLSSGLNTAQLKLNTGRTNKPNDVQLKPTFEGESQSISIGDEETIMSRLDSLCIRFRKVLDTIGYVSHFNKMIENTGSLPRPRKQDIFFTNASEHENENGANTEKRVSVSVETHGLQRIQEDEEKCEHRAVGEEEKKADDQSAHKFDNQLNKGPSERDIQYMKRHYLGDGDGPSALDVSIQYFKKLIDPMANSLTSRVFLDIDSKEKNEFDEIYNCFMSEAHDFDCFWVAYLNTVFARKMKTNEALGILIKFVPLHQRPALNPVIADKYSKSLTWYEEDLETIQHMYDKYKDDPPMLRNAPPVGGAISWSHQLLKQIEEPMTFFRGCRIVAGLKKFPSIVKSFNRLATALVKFETLWLTQWTANVDKANDGMRATLFILDADTKQLVVNVDDKVLELFEESRWLNRLGVQLPESVSTLSKQEARFKSHHDHLKQCLEEYQKIFSSINPKLLPLFETHLASTYQNFSPGMSRFSWNSQNIDAYIYQIHAGLSKLKEIVEQINSIMTSRIQQSILKIRNLLLIDIHLASSEIWPPEEFSKAMKHSIGGQTEVVRDLLSKIFSDIAECVHILDVNKITLEGTEKLLRTSTKILLKETTVFLDFYRKDIEEALLHTTVSSLEALYDLADQNIDPDCCSFLAMVDGGGKLSNRCDEMRTVGTNTSPQQSNDHCLSGNTTKKEGTEKLQFKLFVMFELPCIVINPSLESIQTSLNDVTNTLLTSLISVVKEKSNLFSSDLMSRLQNHPTVLNLWEITQKLQPGIKQILTNFAYYEFLWKDDMTGNFLEFVRLNPELFVISREVDRLMEIESQVSALPSALHCGAICLLTGPIKETLVGFATAWKNLYSSVIMQEAKRLKDEAIAYRNNVLLKLEEDVVTLNQLNEMLILLEELRDMENRIDNVYKPIEELYSKLRIIEPRLSRVCFEEMEGLRDGWDMLLQTSEEVYATLVREKRGTFEQELDKQVKTFVVEVIQFRNSFDSEGPAVQGIDPLCAMVRLAEFQERYDVFASRRKILDSVSIRFSIPCKAFPELDKTGEELDLLSRLYTIYQKYIDFDKVFRETLWADVDLKESSKKVENLWFEIHSLPNKLKEWEAFLQLKNSLQRYMDIIPILNQLASKEIRNRHWLEVMHLTGSSLQLESNVFKLTHLVDISLVQNASKIANIFKSASHELELETRLHAIEDEWTEQVLTFENFKNYGQTYLSVEPTQQLLEQLEDSGSLLTLMLTSRYIGPLREEAASWAMKLKEVAEKLEQWLEAQDLWHCLEAVLNVQANAKMLPLEAKLFSNINQSWIRTMKKASDIKNIIQCCYMDEVASASFFPRMLQDLETCFKSLAAYIEEKRRKFPRFYFVSDQALMTILTSPNNLDSVKPYLRCFFTALTDIQVEVSKLDSSTLKRTKTDESVLKRALNRIGKDPNGQDLEIDREDMSGGKEEENSFEAVAVLSDDGENLQFTDKVLLSSGVESSLSDIQQSVGGAMRCMLASLLIDIEAGLICEEWVHKYSAQVCWLGLGYLWAKDCEDAIVNYKNDRSSVTNVHRKFISLASSLMSARFRENWRNTSNKVTSVQRRRLEAMVTQVTILRDIVEAFANSRIQDVSDFEWRKNLRVGVQINRENTCDVKMSILDEKFDYGYEFFGASQLSQYFPLSDRCIVSMCLTLARQKGCVLTGRSCSGKTETVKSFALITGQHMKLFRCSNTSDPHVIGSLVQGAVMDGCFCCFDDTHMLKKEIWSVLFSNVQSIVQAIRTLSTYCLLPGGREIPVKASYSTFLTYERDTVSSFMSADVRSSFREISLIQPDSGLILQVNGTRLGLKSPAMLASKLKLVTELVKDQLPAQAQHSLSIPVLLTVLKCAAAKKRRLRNFRNGALTSRRDGTKGDRSSSNMCNTPSMALIKSDTSLLQRAGHHTRAPKLLSANGRNDHNLVGQLLVEIIGPRFSPEHFVVFRQIVKDVFYGVNESSSVLSSSSPGLDVTSFESCLEKTAKAKRLVPNQKWTEKCVQLFSLSTIHQGIIVSGPTCSGKSAVIESVVEALRLSSENSESLDSSYKLQKFYPLASNDLSTIFGSMNSSQQWVDGLFTAAWKKAARNQSSTWMCLDGGLSPIWADYFISVLDSTKVLSLSNGDQLQVPANVKFIFETGDLSQASPGLVSRSGILHLNCDTVGWQSVGKAWLSSRLPGEVKVLQKCFDRTIVPIWQYIENECRLKLPQSEVGLFKTCLNLLSAMLADNGQLGSDLHVERLFIYCLMWTFGGLLGSKERKGFSDLLTTLSTALPDDDSDICIFDYYIDEAGDWDPWSSRVPSATFNNTWGLSGEVFVDTVATVRIKLLMDFALASGQSVLLLGPSGSGKTSLTTDLLKTRDLQNVVVKKYTLSGSTTASQLQQFIESNLYHRQGLVYGGRDNRKLQLFIDDINLPQDDGCQFHRCHELLRCVLSDKKICSSEKPFEVHTIEGLTVVSAMTLHSDQPSMSQHFLDERLLQHFAVFQLPVHDDATLKDVVSNILQANLLYRGLSGINADLHDTLVSASCSLYRSVRSALRPSPMSGRQHYLFTLQDIVTCFQSFRCLTNESRNDDKTVVSLWKHEMDCIVKDRLCRYSDIWWFDEEMKTVIDQTWLDLAGNLFPHYISFPNKSISPTDSDVKSDQVLLRPIESLEQVQSYLQYQLKLYNSDYNNKKLNVQLTDSVLVNLIRIYRALTGCHHGNVLLIGKEGSDLSSLIKLSLHMAGFPIFTIDSTSKGTFFDGLRSAIRLTGSEGKDLAICLSAIDFCDPEILAAVSSILVSGFYPLLFTSDEMDGLLQALVPILKKHGRAKKIDPMDLFLSRIKTHLRIVISLPPENSILTSALSSSPGILKGSQIIWLNDWTTDILLEQVTHSLRHGATVSSCNPDVVHGITNAMANIHSYMLTYCHQILHTGSVEDPGQTKIQDKLKDQTKNPIEQLPDKPYSKSLMLENIMRMRQGSETTNQVFVGPSTFKRFIETFHRIFAVKSKERTEKFRKLSQVLESLDDTRKDAKIMKESILDVTKEFQEAEAHATQLQQKLTLESAKLEKLKATLGMSSSSLIAYLQLNEFVVEELKDDDLLKQEDRDEYDDDFDRMRAEMMKSRQVRAREELAATTAMIGELKKKLANSKEQVLFWKSRVNRGCVEKLKAVQTPTILVGHIVEMVMTLIGKRFQNQRSEPKENYPNREEQSGRFSASSGSTRQTAPSSRKSKPGSREAGERFDRAQWKAMQQIMSDTNKFLDMLQDIPWQEGLSLETISAVESFLAKSKNGELGVTGEGTLLDNAPEAEKGFRAQRRSPSPENSKGITIAAAKYSSEDAATLVQYTIAIVEYTRLCGPLKAATGKKHDLENEIQDYERQKDEQQRELERANADAVPTGPSDPDDEDMMKLQQKVDDLQAQLDVALVRKHSLELKLDSMNTRLKFALIVTDSLKSLESEWKAYVASHGSDDVIVANCIMASAFLTYCGALKTDARKQIVEFFQSVCQHNRLPFIPDVVCSKINISNYLFSTEVTHEMKLLGRFHTRLMLENGSFLTSDDHTMAWTLTSDRTRMSIDWLNHCLHNRKLVVIKYPNSVSQLDYCLSKGYPLLVTDVDVFAFLRDENYRSVLQSRNRFIRNQETFKITVGDHDVECNPDFRLYLHTSTPIHEIPAELAKDVLLVDFDQTRADVEDILLDVFTKQEKSRIFDDLRLLSQEKYEHQVRLEELRNQMIDLLSNKLQLTNDLISSKKLTEIKKEYDKVRESYLHFESNERTFLTEKETFRRIARIGSVCWDTMGHLQELNPLYQTAFQQFVEIFQAAVSHSERILLPQLLERLKEVMFTYTSRFLLEKDKPVYSLLLAIELEDAAGHVGPGEREFLISPVFGSITMTALGCVLSPDSKIAQAKKPFDWMLEEQFNNLQLLALHFKWFEDMFDRMPRDGRETQWRFLCESEQPELSKLPDKMDTQLTKLQRVLIIRAVRSDRLLHLSSLFVSDVLGARYCYESAVDLNALVRQSSSATPILFLYVHSSDMAEKMIKDFSKQKKSNLLTVSIVALSDPARLQEIVKSAMNDGSWLLIPNAHTAPMILNRLNEMLSCQDYVNSQFRCWIVAEATAEIPLFILQTSVKILLDNPRNIKDTLLRAFTYVDVTEVTSKQGVRPEWPAVVHNLAYLHGALRLRARLGHCGWNVSQCLLNVDFEDLLEAFDVAMRQFNNNNSSLDGIIVRKGVPWPELKYIVNEVIYGNHLSEPYDQLTLSSMVDYWISNYTARKDFELTKLKYSLPSPLFTFNSKASQLIQALEGIPNELLETPEACNLHTTTETLLGDDQFIFTRLNKIYDAMPSSSSLSHQLFPRPPNPIQGALQANISGTSNNSAVVNMGVFASASYISLQLKKEVDLLDVCSTMLSKLPKTNNKENIAEKIKKIGGMTSFNVFIIKELDMMHSLLNDVKNTLQAIKTACDSTKIGDRLTPAQQDAANDLYHQRIPYRWRHLSGGSAPNDNQALGSWIGDLNNRCQHFDRILQYGREKMPSYWLGAFFYPRCLLAMLKQDCCRLMTAQKGGTIEPVVLRTEITARDKDHIRDPPPEGLFIFGVYLWGCLYDKTTSEILDAPQQQSLSPLPVIHVTCWPQSDQPREKVKPSELYSCPVYQSRIANREPVMELNLSHAGVPSSRWTMRGLFATIRPF